MSLLGLAIVLLVASGALFGVTVHKIKALTRERDLIVMAHNKYHRALAELDGGSPVTPRVRSQRTLAEIGRT